MQEQSQVKILEIFLYNGKKYIEGSSLFALGLRHMIYQDDYNYYEISDEQINEILRSYSYGPVILEKEERNLPLSNVSRIANSRFKDGPFHGQYQYFTDKEEYNRELERRHVDDLADIPHPYRPKAVYAPELDVRKADLADLSKRIETMNYDELEFVKKQIEDMQRGRSR